MITCHLMGGLGNQLFQVAATLATAQDKGKKPIFPPKTNQSCSRKISYNDTYFHKLERTNHPLNYPMFKENGFDYKPINIKNDTKLFGYFQSEKYFNHHRKYILDTLTLPEKLKETLDNKYTNIVNKDNTVSIHVRRGDYLNLQEFHYVQTLDYYVNAIKRFDDNSMFVIFSDDINWCKNISLFNNLKNKQFVQDVDYNELYIMSKCKHNIIANSSFSWWGAYMNNNPNKIIISPQKWFGPKGPKDLNDLRPSSWIIIN